MVEHPASEKNGGLHVVTGAFSYTGRYIALRLLTRGKTVRTLTGHPNRPNPFGGQVGVAPLDFNAPTELARNLAGAQTLYNTYWVRFNHRQTTFDHAIQNTRTLIQAAKEAGVRRLVHVSITNPSEESPLPYFRGKAVIERLIRESGLSYAILRPAVLFGGEDVLVNNLAWLLRHLPVFAVPGGGDYRLQPVHVEELADLAVRAGQQCDNLTCDAVGPEIYCFNDLVELLASTVGSRARILHVNPRRSFWLSRLAGLLVRDVVLTWEEVEGLMANLLVSAMPPTTYQRLSEWLRVNAQRVGTRYASELARHYR